MYSMYAIAAYKFFQILCFIQYHEINVHILMMKHRIVFAYLLFFVFEEFSEAQKTKKYGDIHSYPYIGRALTESFEASDAYSMRTIIFPVVSFTFHYMKIDSI